MEAFKAYQPKPSTIKNADLIMAVVNSTPEPITLRYIAKKLGRKDGRHADLSLALKYLVNHEKVTKSGIKRASKYAPIERPATITAQEAAEIPKPVEKRPYIVEMLEIPKPTLKVLVKAVMANCSPMDALLQRAVLQCMEKLI